MGKLTGLIPERYIFFDFFLCFGGDGEFPLFGRSEFALSSHCDSVKESDASRGDEKENECVGEGVVGEKESGQTFALSGGACDQQPTLKILRCRHHDLLVGTACSASTRNCTIFCGGRTLAPSRALSLPH